MDKRARVTDHGPRWRRASSGREHRQPLTTSQEDGHKRGRQSTHLPLTATDSEWAGGRGGGVRVEVENLNEEKQKTKNLDVSRSLFTLQRLGHLHQRPGQFTKVSVILPFGH